MSTGNAPAERLSSTDLEQGSMSSSLQAMRAKHRSFTLFRYTCRH